MPVSKETLLHLKSKLSPVQQKLLEKRLRGESNTNASENYVREQLPSIYPRREDWYKPFPLTDVQQAYWVGRNSAFELGQISTHGYVEIETTDLNLERFETAWQQLIDRHEMLRAIVKNNGQQQILEQVPPYKIDVVDLRGKDSEIANAKFLEIRDRLSHQMFAIDRWPLFEIAATRLSEHHLRYHISIDVLIGDAWSFEIILRELAELIESPDLSRSPFNISFRDYVLAEIAFRNSERYSRSLNYWQNRLATLPPSPELPLKKSVTEVEQPSFVRRSQLLDSNTWNRLKSRATQANLTPSVLLLAAFSEIITVWSKSPRFTVNLTLFNRLPVHPEVNQIAGDFTSLTLLEVNNSGADSFEVRAQRIQQQLWDDIDHRYVSGIRVLRELARLQRRPLGALMPVVFTSTLTNESLRENFNQSSDGNAKDVSIQWPGKIVYMITQTPQVYLDHQVYEQDGKLVLNWDAVEELFPDRLLDEMFAAYCHLLEGLATSEQRWQTKTRQLLPQEQLQQITAINATDTPLATEGTLLHTLFFERVKEHPQHTAIATSQCTFSYQQLSLLVVSLARQLRQKGARPNQLVAVVMEKGWEQVVAVLGILTAGAAYVPIDPALPVERRQYLCQQTQAQWILTQSKLDNALEWPAGIERLCIDQLEASATVPIDPVQKPEDIAYIIYTSGSTGMPKGVTINHQGAVNTILDINQRFGISERDRVFALSSLSFDLSVYDIFGMLAAGGTIVIPDPDSTKNPARWVELMQQYPVTVWNSVPALMQMLVEYIGDRTSILPESPRLVMLSGDWLPLTLSDRLQALFEDVQVVSLGGATEASIWSILYPIKTLDPTWKSIPYGRPMTNQRFYVLDDQFEPRPMWVPGQLYIGGIGLALGYWQDEEKTAASFINHPRTGERLYRTGDLGRYLPDGTIEFLGREDFQVKINGYRIELGEIEAALRQYPALETAIVQALGESPTNKRLVAYIIVSEESDFSHNEGRLKQELLQFLQTKLPEYAIPAEFVILKSLPLTPNGKIDRKALPKPDLQSEEKAAYVSPKTELERTLATLIGEVLQLEKVGIADNFFDLGGNSVHMIQVHTKIREFLGKEIPIVEMFRNPTIAALSNYLNRESAVNAHQKLSRAQLRKAAGKRRTVNR